MTDPTTALERRCRHCGTAAVPGFAYCSKCGAAIGAPSGRGDALIEAVRALFDRELEVERELGRGGMAVVYAAQDMALQRRVAVKVLLPEYARDEAMTARFLQEARTVAALQHPHVVSLYGVRSNGELSAIVMQFVDGRSLDVLLELKPKPAAPVAGLLLSQAASGLQHAHDRGIVHRDVKPANILVDRDGRAVVSDFGIALREGTTRLTETGMVIGTMAYMSPEQRAGGLVGPAADQYALGVMAYELFAGRLPFSGGMAEMMAHHLQDAPPPLGAVRQDLAAFVVNTVHRMLEKKPESRFKDLREPERVFRMLAPDEKATTRILAAMSTGEVHDGSRVQNAVRVPGRAVSAPTDPATAAADVTLELPADPPAPVMRRRSSAQRMRRRVQPFVIAAAAAGVIAGGALAWRVWQTRKEAAALLTRRQRAAAVAEPVPQPSKVTTAPAAEPPVLKSQQLPQEQGKPVPVPSGTRPGAGPPSSRRTEAGAPVQAFPTPPASAPMPLAAPPAPTKGTDAASPPASVSASSAMMTLAEARTAARQFVTILNQHRWSELEQMESLGGDATMRAELIRQTKSATDFAAGFDRVASVPLPSEDGFTTEFVLDLEWRGGKRLVAIRLRAVPQGGAWRLAAFRVTAPN